MERTPIKVYRQPIMVEREPIEVYRDDWLPVYWYRYGTGELVMFPNYVMNYKAQIKRVSTDTFVKVYPTKKKDNVVLYLDGYAFCINLEDIIQATLLDKFM